MENNLPEGWDVSNLENLIIYIIGGDWGNDLVDSFSLDLVKAKVVRGTDYKSWNEVRSKNAPIRLLKKSSIEKRRLEYGDIVLEVSGGGPDQPVGRTIVIDAETLNGENMPIVCSNFFRQMRISPLIDSFYVNYYLKHAYHLGFINEFQTQTTNLRNLNVNEFISKTNVPIPPLPEQQRIVAKLVAIMERVERNKQRLDKIPALLKRFRQSVLAAAVSGRLTEEWRKKNEEIQNGKALYERIRKENDFKEFELKDDDLKLFPEIPDSWIYTPIGNVSSFQQGMQIAKSTRIKEKIENSLPILRIKNYSDGFRSDVEYCMVDENTLIAEKDDIILARTGETRGKVLTGYKGIFHNNCFRINFPTNYIDKDYLLFHLNVPCVQEFIIRNSNNTGQPDLTHKSFGPCPFALPPYLEQKEIARCIEQLFSYSDKIEAHYTKATIMLDKLPQSILAKAFRGELVPQDPNDEPASVLLERIKAEKEEQSGKKKVKVMKNKATPK